MSLDSAIARFRRRERELARSTCIITRPVEGRVFNPETGVYTDPTPTPIYSGWCTVRPADRAGQDTEAGETELRLNEYEVKVAHNTLVKVDDIVLVLTSPDVAMAGKRLRVTDVPVDDRQVVRRVVVEEVT